MSEGLEFGGQAVDCAEDVDVLTITKIRAAAGGVDEQLKMLRHSIKAVAVLSNPQYHPDYIVKRSQETATKMEALDNQIEAIVDSGRKFKQLHGLT